MTKLVEVPGYGEVEFPDSMSTADIEKAAQRLVAEKRLSPEAPPDPMMYYRQNSGGNNSAPMSLPFGLGKFNVGGPLASLVRGASSVQKETSFPIVGATLATAAAPATFGASLLAAGMGGGLGGAAAASDKPGADAQSIAKAGLESGAEMAVAQLAGMGLSAAAKRLIAPNLKFMDPLKSVRAEVSRRTGQAVKGRTAQQLVDAWNKMSASQRASMSPASQEILQGLSKVTTGISRMGKAFNHPILGEVAESAAVPAIGAMFGPGAALSASIGKALFRPGPVARYLSRSQLPNQAVRTVADQATKLGLRAYMAKEDEDQ